MSEARPSLPHVAAEEAVVESYRAVSPSAVAALLLGLASPLVLVSPVLAVVPLAAVLFAIAGLRSIATSSGQLMGRTLALVGVVLAMFSLGAGLSWSLSRQARLEGDARRFAEDWLAIVARGDLQMAHQLRIPRAKRAAELSLDNFYKANSEAAKDLQSLVSSPPLGDFIGLGPQVKYRCLGSIGHSGTAGSDTIVLECSFDRPRQQPQVFWLTVTRTVDEDNQADWQIDGLSSTHPLL